MRTKHAKKNKTRSEHIWFAHEEMSSSKLSHNANNKWKWNGMETYKNLGGITCILYICNITKILICPFLSIPDLGFQLELCSLFVVVRGRHRHNMTQNTTYSTARFIVLHMRECGEGKKELWHKWLLLFVCVATCSLFSLLKSFNYTSTCHKIFSAKILP